MAPRRGLSRRDLLTRFRRLVDPAALTAAKETAVAALSPMGPWIRPPGADVANFAALCDGCGDCARACPHASIIILDDRYGDDAASAAVRLDGPACRLCEDRPCVTACRTGALTEQRREVAVASVRIMADRCTALAGSGCQACYDACPRRDRGMWHNGFSPVIDHEQCLGCAACFVACSDGALTVSAKGAT